MPKYRITEESESTVLVERIIEAAHGGQAADRLSQIISGLDSEITQAEWEISRIDPNPADDDLRYGRVYEAETGQMVYEHAIGPTDMGLRSD